MAKKEATPLVIARAARKSAMRRYSEGSLKFDELLGLSQKDEFKSLKRLRLVNLLAAHNGWNKESITTLFLNNGFGPDTRLGEASSRKNLYALAVFVINNAGPPSNNVEKVPGWPWRGSVLKAVSNLPGDVKLKELEAVIARSEQDKKSNLIIDDSSIDEIVDDVSEPAKAASDLDDFEDMPDPNSGSDDSNILYDLLGTERN